MKEIQKTLILLVVAAVLLFLSLQTPDSSSEDLIFSDLGKEFYPDFKDPLDVTSLEVFEYNEDIAAVTPFKVLLKNGQWTIPSHYDYPVDAKEKMEKISSLLVGITKDEIRSDKPSDHKDLELIDPNDTQVQALAGRGTRVILKNEQGRILADYILGKVLDGRPEYRFVRQPENNKCYASKISIDLSSKFSDWINTALLNFSAAEARTFMLSDYKVDQGTLLQGESYQLNKKDSDWVTDNIPDGKELDQSKVSNIFSTLSDLKIVGVRRKPKGLAATLSMNKDMSLSPADVSSLAEKGFYITKDGQLFNDEGEATFAIDSGISYTIRFGNSFFGSELEISSGKSSKEKDKDTEQSQSASRYLFIMAQVDSSILGEAPSRKEKPAELTEAADESTEKAHNEEIALYKKAEEEYEKWLKTKQEAENKVSELNRRFADWYYVIDGNSYDNIRITFDNLLKNTEQSSDSEAPQEDAGN